MQTDIKQRKFFEKQAESWHHKIDDNTRDRLKTIFREKIPTLKAPLLDIGSGTGILLPELYKNISGNFPLFEADYSWKMLDQNRTNNRAYDQINYIQTDSHALPFKDNHFGSIVCFAAFAHFIDKPRVIQEFRRVLQPRGKLIILHLMCHYKLNKLHSQVGGAVKYDNLPAIKELSTQMMHEKFSVLNYEEDKTIYLMLSQK